jgi:plasmid stabilization system protein ParE
MKVRFEVGAVADLHEIFEYIATDNPLAAKKLVDRIEHVASLIGEQPGIGHKTGNPLLRTFPVRKYLIVFEVAPDEVVIHYVRHAARKRTWRAS